ncbi:MAG: hypothetical protein CME64_18130 [Halobacteriovoraceae bacterium]|nr:hypothetical protein [Halobacteriovoraceae bacterium]|tara:strand:+ start:39786 stop:40301 length:516 start_codon:yes stop_codon:yes gene_type:complete
MKTSKLFIALICAVFSVQSYAGFLIEPYAGYGTIATTTDVPSDDNETEAGAFVGGRLGYSFLLVSAGIDYNTGSAGDYDRTSTSAFVGVDLPILLRFYGKYTFSSDLENSDNDFDYDFKSGYAVGVGFTGLPFVSLNLEAGAEKYEVEVLGQDYDVDAANILATVSLPLDF